jgi:hypothetical protein
MEKQVLFAAWLLPAHDSAESSQIKSKFQISSAKCDDSLDCPKKTYGSHVYHTEGSMTRGRL